MTTKSPPPRAEIVPPQVLRLRPAVVMDDDRLQDFCAQNKELRIERNTEGDLETMAPTGGETSDRNAEVTTQLRLWAKRSGNGIAFDTPGGFVLPTARCARRTPPGCGASG